MLCPYSDLKKFVTYLYGDKLELVNDIEFDYSNPTIICVVKNEDDKLINFFKHYNGIGKINYLFIDNNSSDDTIKILKDNNAKIYTVKENFLTVRKLAWINKVYSTIPNNSWTILLDADELLVYHDLEKISINDFIRKLECKSIDISGAVMLDMYSQTPCLQREYIKHYRFFQNKFFEKKSYWYTSIYGGIRDREFNFKNERIFLIKKHPLVKKYKENIIISCHYIYPFHKNLKSTTYLGLLHYKLFDKEIDKYKRIAEEGSYGKGGGSVEYKLYLKKFKEKKYEDIFKNDIDTLEYKDSNVLNDIKIIKKIL